MSRNERKLPDEHELDGEMKATGCLSARQYLRWEQDPCTFTLALFLRLFLSCFRSFFQQ